MGKTLDATTKGKVHHAEVVHHGEALVLPENMSPQQAVTRLLDFINFQEQKINVQRSYGRFPWDGAYALYNVLVRRFGTAMMNPQRGPFGEKPPQMIEVEIDLGKFVSVPWGEFQLTVLDGGVITCGFDAGQFVLQATVRRKDEAYVRDLFDEVEAELKAHSIYLGKAVRLVFEEDEELPKISFVDVRDGDINRMIYSRDVEGAIHTNLFTPIERIDDCLENDISVKRGVLLAGPYGTGKTMAAKAAANLAVANDVTFVYADAAADFAKVFQFAKTYCDRMAVVFCEDIDRVTAGARSAEVDEVLNIMDGVDSKNFNIMTVLTTNALDRITPAMQRPGRLDAIIDVTPPDAEAAERLVRAYGGSLIEEDADLSDVGEELAGYVPAVIAEVVKRAKLSQLRRIDRGEKLTFIGSEALLEALVTIRPQAERLKDAVDPHDVPTVDSTLSGVIDARVATAVKPMRKALDRLEEGLL